MSTSTFSTNGTHNIIDEAIDSLYAWMAPQPPARASCPEALFSLTLKGTLDGHETLLTVRGMTATEFQANVVAIRGLLDQPQPVPPVQASSQGPGWCSKHGVQMTLNTKDGRSWFSHQVDGCWCKGK